MSAPGTPRSTPRICHSEPVRLLILGASGTVGQLTTNALLECGINLALTAGIDPVFNDSKRAQEYRERDAHVQPVDFANEDSLRAIINDNQIQSICLILPWQRGIVPMMANVLTVVRQSASVKFIVKMSSMMAFDNTPGPVGAEHFQCDTMLAQSGIPHCLVKPCILLDNIVKFQGEMIRSQSVFYACTNKSAPYVSGADVADVLTTLLLNPHRWSNKTLVLTGKEQLSPAMLCTAMSRIFGRTISVKMIDEATMKKTMGERGIPAFMQEDIIAMERERARDRFSEITDTVKKVTGHPPRSCESFFAEWKDSIQPSFSLKQLLHFFI